MFHSVDLSSVFVGFAVGLSLIVAIGAQNAFVLRVGLTRTHVLPVVAICALSDAVLLFAGVSGIGVLLERAPTLITGTRILGAIFLLGYAAFAARRAWRQPTSNPEGRGPGTAVAAVTTALALTWLNPHVYLDTVILTGSIANGRQADGRWWFTGGAVAAGVVWFSALGYGAQLLTPFFEKPGTWRILDAAIAVMMTILGISLLVEL
ncbi:L-lysine exporter family protein LysE/ArgO [Rhodococcus sp. 27YEA15]|uniref:LysE/ArgO family amino acid transporter n=1 Tax=Rhodococcus sp. 27YEA15 TaxID=3156259 RepID=UPI003C7D3D57